MTEITIRSGALVEVDSDAVRRVATGLRRLVADAGETVAQMDAAVDLITQGQPSTFAAVLDATVLRAVLERVGQEGEDIVEKVTSAAALYEAVELRVEAATAAAAGDTARMGIIDARLARLWAQEPSAVAAADVALEHRPPAHLDLYGQALVGGQGLGPMNPWLAFPSLYGVVDALRLGVIPPGARLVSHGAVPVRVSPVARAAATPPPSSLADAASRIPSAGAAQVRVERYAMADGTRQFGVFVAGTRSGGAIEPFDIRSNLELYTGRRSASYEAVGAALHDAGARDGDVVHAFGHSQGAMVIERLALEGGYDTRTLVSFGSPVQADVGADTLGISVRHTDDPVSALQSGGHVTGVGAPGSFVVERLADPAAGIHDLRMPAHALASYTETAALIDASTDPRAAAVRDVFAALGRAEAADATEYVAERVSLGAPAGAGAG
ncbi:hypothetical protein DEU34_2599 [Microbacterium sp. AG1240]|uniref:hypothetical protein n=1 Tax=Microbacterium sp. AG1240 TaxID=2183992 RepID=UPI000EB43F3C|nr:hypothetical protein [Microbacterium sp. AG1240]RKT31529.1 hypothetical protein DEU34_2599 [Microbacterium sp. AG1240]